MAGIQVSGGGWGGARKGAGRPRGPWPLLAWRNAVRVAALRRGPDGVRRLDRAVQVLLDLGMQGNWAALKLIGDTLDGKVPTAKRHNAQDSPSFVVRTPWPESEAGTGHPSGERDQCESLAGKLKGRECAFELPERLPSSP